MSEPAIPQHIATLRLLLASSRLREDERVALEATIAWIEERAAESARERQRSMTFTTYPD